MYCMSIYQQKMTLCELKHVHLACGHQYPVVYLQLPIKLIEKMTDAGASDHIVTEVNNKSMAFSWSSTHMNAEGNKDTAFKAL